MDAAGVVQEVECRATTASMKESPELIESTAIHAFYVW